MKYYIASSFKNLSVVRALDTELNQRGFVNTYDWTNAQVNNINDLRKIGLHEKEAVLSSDVFILVFPAGKGANTEFGLALATNKNIYIYATNSDIWSVDKTSSFYHLPNVKIVDSNVHDLINEISRTY